MAASAKGPGIAASPSCLRFLYMSLVRSCSLLGCYMGARSERIELVRQSVLKCGRAHLQDDALALASEIVKLTHQLRWQSPGKSHQKRSQALPNLAETSPDQTLFPTGFQGSERTVRNVSHPWPTLRTVRSKGSNRLPMFRTGGSKDFPPWPTLRTVRSKGFKQISKVPNGLFESFPTSANVTHGWGGIAYLEGRGGGGARYRVLGGERGSWAVGPGGLSAIGPGRALAGTGPG